MIENSHFEGQRNITEGDRNSDDAILPEIINELEDDTLALGAILAQKATVFVSTVQTGTGASQDIAHTLVDDAGDPVVPSHVLPIVIDDAAGAIAFVEGVHTSALIKMTAPIGLTYKVVAIY